MAKLQIEVLEEIRDILSDIREQNTRPKARSKGVKPFKPPTEAEVAEYAAGIDYNLDGTQFVDFYASKNWMVGKSKMKDWQACVRTWAKRQAKATKTKLYPIKGRNCSESDCRMPAVYKSTGGSYDFFYCSKHMPKAVKRQYE